MHQRRSACRVLGRRIVSGTLASYPSGSVVSSTAHRHPPTGTGSDARHGGRDNSNNNARVNNSARGHRKHRRWAHICRDTGAQRLRLGRNNHRWRPEQYRRRQRPRPPRRRNHDRAPRVSLATYIASSRSHPHDDPLRLSPCRLAARRSFTSPGRQATHCRCPGETVNDAAHYCAPSHRSCW